MLSPSRSSNRSPIRSPLDRPPTRTARRRTLRQALLALAVPATAIGLALVTGRGAHAEGAGVDQAEANERCAIRLSIALVGKSPDAQLMTGAPQSGVDTLLASAEFSDRYARFINAEFNGGPSTNAANDPIYWLAKKIVADDAPWTEMFVGGWAVDASANGGGMDVTKDPNGLGYFRTTTWRTRYAGNEPQGYMLTAAFRILSNTVGLTLVPSVGQPGDDRTTTGRKAAACKGCHYDAWYALDTFARLLPRKSGQGDVQTFTPPNEGPQTLLGKTITDDRQLVQSLVDSDAWRFNQCRNVFKFLYGRPENQCEAPVFDACVDALAQKKTIRSAVAVVAKDPSFCQ